MKIRCAVALIFLAAGGLRAADEKPVVEWIRANAIRLQSPEAGHGFADMQPLKKVIGDARIVSLGEATHGSREFFQLKHRMMEFLATEMGFTIFSIEANMPEAYRLNEYVLTGRGDPKKLLKGMYFWTWNTEEVLDMILWMREFNKSGKGRVEFTGFDMQTPTVAMEIARDFVAKYEPSYSESLTVAARLAAKTGPSRSGGNFGVVTGTFPIKGAAGKKVRFSGFIRTENVDRFAGLWWRVDGKSGVLAFDNMQSRGIRGTKEWERYSIELPVAEDATNINFGALLTGKGAAWFSGLSIELDGQLYADKSDFDMEFSSYPVRGFYTGGNGYLVRPDKETTHEGQASLMMRHTGGAPETPKADPKEAVAAWQDVVSHLNASRQSYVEKKASETEIEWAIQNATVTRQCMEMFAGKVSRDESMAANVKWILDHSPKAKIVLWAHNGHVNTSGFRGYRPMGEFLRRSYGDQMKVFGFAFHQGSFQAMATGKGLQNFTVPPAPAGSFDAMLAAAEIPLFALDLGAAPKTGPVSEWLDAGGKSRNIGALYPEDSPYAFMQELKSREAYDALLFVEKTSAARKVVEPKAEPRAKGSEGPSEYSDAGSRVGLKLPAGWWMKETAHFGDQESAAYFAGPDASVSPVLYSKLFKTPEPQSAEVRKDSLRHSSEIKPAQRIKEGFSDYHLREGSCEFKTTAGMAAHRCIADCTVGGKKMVEYLTWFRTDGAHALFFVRTSAEGLEQVRRQVDPIIETLRLP